MVAMHWYALYVKPRHEKKVDCILRGKGFEGFLPEYRKKTPSRSSDLPLFPGYVFCRLDTSRRLPVLMVPGVFAIVGFGGIPAHIEDSEIESLKTVVASGLPRQPWPEVPAGSNVRIASGPLKGVRGVVTTHRTGYRLIVSIELLQRSVAVDVPTEHVEVECASSGAIRC